MHIGLESNFREREGPRHHAYRFKRRYLVGEALGELVNTGVRRKHVPRGKQFLEYLLLFGRNKVLPRSQFETSLIRTHVSGVQRTRSLLCSNGSISPSTFRVGITVDASTSRPVLFCVGPSCLSSTPLPSCFLPRPLTLGSTIFDACAPVLPNFLSSNYWQRGITRREKPIHNQWASQPGKPQPWSSASSLRGEDPSSKPFFRLLADGS